MAKGGIKKRFAFAVKGNGDGANAGKAAKFASMPKKSREQYDNFHVAIATVKLSYWKGASFEGGGGGVF
jgi:hypothetical protein